ncbi:MAG: hypothetical protein RMJ55_13555 [Roseiflexaceae bacterium]|nr:hypothetical protein [Roseiflexus sp.]MDW8214580.1 hypothetical protein [Roseiflexaceae bacterium]
MGRNPDGVDRYGSLTPRRISSHNHRTQSELVHIMARRVDLIADALGFERTRIVGRGLAQAVLSAWWSYEDHGHRWDEAIACAEALRWLQGAR